MPSAVYDRILTLLSKVVELKLALEKLGIAARRYHFFF